MRPYGVHPHRPAIWSVPASPAPLQRLNRVAAGMAATLERRKRRHRWNPRFMASPDINISGEALRLTVHGTLDPLAAIRFDLERAPCGCCGSRQNSKLRLKGKPRSRGRLVLKLNPDRLP